MSRPSTALAASKIFAGLGLVLMVSTPAVATDSILPERARAVLLRALREETGWIRVHAAEALVAVGETREARAVFSGELPQIEASPFRIGAWRVLAATAVTAAERTAWIDKTQAVFLLPAAPDRLQSIESLAKLGVVVVGPVLDKSRSLATTAPEAEQPLGLWALHLAGDRTALDRTAALLGSTDAVARLRAAYLLRRLRPDSAAIRARLGAALATEPADSIARPFLLSAALSLAADPVGLPVWRAEARELLARSANAGAIYELCQTLMEQDAPADAARFTPLLDHAGADARIGGAWAILRLLAPTRR